MAPELGKIEKSALEEFRSGRKLFCVPLVPHPQGEGVKEELKQKIIQYWKQVTEQIGNLENVGRIMQVYHETITSKGEQALNDTKSLNEKSYELVKAKCEAGAQLEAIEDQETFSEYLDWSVCLSVIGRSPKVAREVASFHKTVAEKRVEGMAKKIDELLRDGEAALLIMADENRIRLQGKLPPDIQIFLVHPPAFNDIQSLLREYILNLAKQRIEEPQSPDVGKE
ncbi:MAG: hypothetical protein NWE81_00775 [Candidatus Bathyarchaeota archaeon]|nr:hypothetical protein [Candidatus Bathyarchaeota archaeon]